MAASGLVYECLNPDSAVGIDRDARHNPSAAKTFYVVCQVALLIFSGRLAHFLSSDVGQVVILVVRFVISPHHKDNLEPLCAQSP